MTSSARAPVVAARCFNASRYSSWLPQHAGLGCHSCHILLAPAIPYHPYHTILTLSEPAACLFFSLVTHFHGHTFLTLFHHTWSQDMVEEVLDDGYVLEELQELSSQTSLSQSSLSQAPGQPLTQPPDAGSQTAGPHESMTLAHVRAVLRSREFVAAAHSAAAAHTGMVRGLQSLSLPQVASALRGLASRLVFVRTLATRCVVKAAGPHRGEDITRAGDNAGAARVFVFECARSGRCLLAQPPPGAVTKFFVRLFC